MPTTIQGSRTINTPEQVRKMRESDVQYEYPFDLNLRPGSEVHDRLRDRILDRAFEARRKMKTRYRSWNDIDQTMNAYIPLTEEEKDIQKDDENRPVSIVVPTSYATLQTLLTYMTAAFLQEPMFKYEGVGPEDVPKAIIGQHLVQNQMKRMKAGLVVHTLCADAYKYNAGAAGLSWFKDSFTVSDVRERRGVFSEVFVTDVNERVRFEGNKIISIDPYDLLPDTNFPLYQIQEMEYVGWTERSTWATMLREEESDITKFNTQFLRHIDGRSQLFEEDNTARHKAEEKNFDRRTSEDVYTKPIDRIFMYIDLIPSDWGLGDIDAVETWSFELAGDEVITRAQPLGFNHGKKPVVCASPDYDGHSVVPISRLEVEAGMQKAVNWFYNARVANLRKAINNMLAVDPWIINYNDVIDTKAGMVARARKAVGGLGKLSEGIIPIPVQDTTGTVLNDINIMMQLIKDTSGARDIVSGNIPARGERVSASEASFAAQGALSWLEKDARLIFLQALQDIGEMAFSNTAQLMSEDSYVKITGDLTENIAKEFNLDVQRGRVIIPKDFLGEGLVDVMPHDGSVPGATGDAASMIQFFQIIANSEQLIQQFDVFRIAKSIARRIGIRDVETWVRQNGVPNIRPQVVPDEEVERQAQAGNLEPLSGTGVGSNGGTV